MPQAHARPSANDCFGDACGQRRLGGAGPAGVPLVVLHGFGGASGVLRSCRRSADPISTISGASGVPFAPPGCRRPRGMLQQALLCCFRRSSNMLPSQRFFAKLFRRKKLTWDLVSWFVFTAGVFGFSCSEQLIVDMLFQEAERMFVEWFSVKCELIGTNWD